MKNKAVKRGSNVTNCGAPDSHSALILDAKRVLKNHKKETHFVDVYEERPDIFDPSKMIEKFVYQIQSYSVDRLKKAMKIHSKRTERILHFTEIKPISHGKNGL